MKITKMAPATQEWEMGNSIDVYFADSERLEKGWSQVRVSVDFESNKSDDFHVNELGDIFSKGLRFEYPSEIATIFNGTVAVTHSKELTKDEKTQIAKAVYEKYQHIWSSVIA